MSRVSWFCRYELLNNPRCGCEFCSLLPCFELVAHNDCEGYECGEINDMTIVEDDTYILLHCFIVGVR